MSEDVRHQHHYDHGIQPIDYIESRFTAEELRGFLVGNVIKYVSRFTRKDGLRDLDKALVYLVWLIRAEGGQADDPRVDRWNELQDRIAAWADRTFPGKSLASTFEHLREELEEIEETPDDPHEWADVLLMLVHAAKSEGFSMSALFDACEAKLAICQQRKWLPPDENGVVRHDKRDERPGPSKPPGPADPPEGPFPRFG